MSPPRYFTDCPPFPSGVPIANLPTISLKELEQRHEQEAKDFFHACRYYGFFLLDLSQSEQGKVVLKDAEGLYDLTGELYKLEQAELDGFAYNPKVSLIGYKKSGLLRTDDGTFDTTDLYTIGQDDVLNNEPPRSNPAPIESHRPLCRAFCQHAHSVVATLLSTLESQLGLPESTLAELSSLTKPSQTALRLLQTKPEVPVPPSRRVTLGAHTDIGLITLLFNGAGGLQILPPGCDNVDANWRYIRPQPGCALINLGDTLVEWTGGLLRSSLHRVVTAPGEQGSVTRRSFGYFMRPAREATMKRLRGEKSIIPLDDEREGDDRLVDVWAAERAAQIIRGEIRPQSFGGVVKAGLVA